MMFFKKADQKIVYSFTKVGLKIWNKLPKMTIDYRAA